MLRTTGRGLKVAFGNSLWNNIYPPRLRQVTVELCRSGKVPMAHLISTFKIMVKTPECGLIGIYGLAMGAKMQKEALFCRGISPWLTPCEVCRIAIRVCRVILLC